MAGAEAPDTFVLAYKLGTGAAGMSAEKGKPEAARTPVVEHMSEAERTWGLVLDVAARIFGVVVQAEAVE